MSQQPEPGIMTDLREMCARLSEVGIAETQSHAILAAYDTIVAERDAAIAECMEQARLNGMGSEREAKLMAERDALTARLAACEKIVEAAKAYEKWMGKWHDYTVSCGDKPAKQQRALIDAVRAAVAADTHTPTEDTDR